MGAWLELIYSDAGQIAVTECQRLCPVIQRVVMSGLFAESRSLGLGPGS